MKRVISSIGNIIFIMIVLYLCYFIIASAYHKSPSIFGYRMLQVLSDSMQPVFGSGDCIIIKKTQPDQLAEGDIITFVSKDPAILGSYNTHRIIDIVIDRQTQKKIYFTAGDYNTRQDAYIVEEEDIVGKYVGNLPFGRTVFWLLNKLLDQKLYFAVVILPVLICFVSCLLQLIREICRK